MKYNYFNFKPFKDKILMTNDFGKFAFIEAADLKSVLSKDVDLDSELGRCLQESKMIYNEADIAYSANHRYDMREIKGYLGSATALHIFVVTTACNMNCVYCQANNGTHPSHTFMTEETAEKAVDIALQSPEPSLSFEFQGGEPLLNFKVIKHIIQYAEQHKGNHFISYNVVSNLTLLTDEMLTFFVDNKVGISTSLDGFEALHNINRPFLSGEGTYSSVVKGIQKVREAGIRIGAIETTTKASLSYPKEIVNAYASLGFDSVFIRPLTPLGKAAKYWDTIGYTPEEFVAFYAEALNAIIEVNKTGRYFKEAHASILLSRIDGQSVNYMELRSPCGAAVGQLAYYADGNIFTCDEGRMMSEMGHNTFLLGNVFTSSYKDLIKNSVCKTVCASSILETIPSCCDCVYQPYCGTCPVVNYAMTNDVIEKQPRSYRCKIYSGILDALFSKFYEGEQTIIDILRSWRN